MPDAPQHQPQPAGAPAPAEPEAGAFPATRWTLIARATGADEAARRPALEELCRLYWYPLYCYARRRGLAPEEAEDATQEFLAAITTRQSLPGQQEEKLPLRAWLRGAFSNALASRWRRDHRLKRGGGPAPASAEERYLAEPADYATPEHLYDLRWALAVLEEAFAALAADYERAGKAALFHALKGHLAAELPRGGAEALAPATGLSPGGVRTALSRLRQRYRAHITAVLAGLVHDPSAIDAEMACLQASLAPPSTSGRS